MKQETATASQTKDVRPSPSTYAWRRRSGVLVGMLRRLFSVAALFYAAACVVLFVLGLVRGGRAPQLPVIQLLHQAVDPVVGLATGLKLNFSYRGVSFLLPGLAVGVWLLRQFVNRQLATLEGRLRMPPAESRGAMRALMDEKQAEAVTKSGPREVARGSLLREYAQAKRILGEAKRQMAFLSIDVVGSTKMKLGEDKIVIEHAFSEYKKFLERIFREFKMYKVAWTPDGVMTCFPTTDDAVGAARKLLTELDWFNRDVHQLHTQFRVRCGLNFGEVLVPDPKPLEEISDEVIDVAGHLQKYAEVDSLWVSAEAYRRISDRSGFTHVEKQVDNRDVYAWRRASPLEV